MQYGVQGSGSTQTTSVSVTEATISGLTPSTTYSIEVAAVTGGDRIGVYSTPIFKKTDGKHLLIHGSMQGFIERGIPMDPPGKH